MKPQKKEPWLPPKPKKAMRCGTCRGSGEMMLWNPQDYHFVASNCPKCGGKGFIH